ncbi:hypothetical protein ES708_20612 [subsurface metagenome]
MMKINLSGNKEEPQQDSGNEADEQIEKTMIEKPPPMEKTMVEAPPPQKEPAAEKAMPPPPEEPATEKAKTPPPPEKPKKKKKKARKSRAGKKQLKLLLAVLIVLFIAVVVMQKDTIMTMIKGGTVDEEIIMEPPPPEPEIMVAQDIPEEPDPVFVAINNISSIIPERTWLTSFIVMFDGTYVIKGMAFTHGAAVTFGESLGGIGTVSSQTIPDEVKSSESIYNFTIAGSLHNIHVPEILDNIPTDNLIALASGIKGRGEELGISFTQFPETGKIYGEKSLPFGLLGTYEGLKEVVAELCPVDGDTRIYRLVIRPAEPGKGFDTINAAFSIRTVPSI